MNLPLLNKIITSEDSVLSLIKSGEKDLLITYINQHCFNISKSDPEYLNLLCEKFTIYSDGVGIYFALKYLQFHPLHKFNASDLNQKVFNYFIQTHTPLYFLGGHFIKTNLLNQMTKKGLNVVGYSNGFSDTANIETLFEGISKSGAEFILIGISVPKQEKIAYKLASRLPGKSFLCVGNFLEFYLGTQKRAPLFLRNSGFEWLFRLVTEPQRLWKRYIIGIPIFILRVLNIRHPDN